MYKGKFEWPNGAYIAAVFNMSWEIPPKTLGTTGDQSRGRGASSAANYIRLMRPVYETAFAETGGMQRLLDLWKRYEIQTSTYADGLNVSLFPELSREVAANGHEFLVQGWDHEFLCDMTAQEQADGIAGANKAFETCLAKGLRASVLLAGTLRRKLSPSSLSKGSNTPAACATPKFRLSSGSTIRSWSG